MKCKKAWFFFALLGIGIMAATQIIDEIYIIVNEEVITLRDIQEFEQQNQNDLETRLTGEELEKAKKELQQNLIDLLINQRVMQSKLKEKNYNVEAEVDALIQEIKKQNNFSSDEELKQALKSSEGLEFSQWKDHLREMRKIMHLREEEIGSKIKIDNSQIMEYYKNHTDEFTIPEEVTVHAIYLKKEEGGSDTTELRGQIQEKVTAENFAEIAKSYSQLPEAAESPLLGTFKKGELSQELETHIQQMKTGILSPWIETVNGWYILKLDSRKEAALKNYGEVKDSIHDILMEERMNDKMKEYIESLKKESYIKIVKTYPPQ